MIDLEKQSGLPVLWDGATRTVAIEYNTISLVEEPEDEEIPASSGAIGVFDNGDIRIVIDKVEFNSSEKKFHIYGKADFNGKKVILSVFDSKGNVIVADFVNFGNEQKLKSFEAVLNTGASQYNPESIIINAPDKEGNKMVRIASIDI